MARRSALLSAVVGLAVVSTGAAVAPAANASDHSDRGAVMASEKSNAPKAESHHGRPGMTIHKVKDPAMTLVQQPNGTQFETSGMYPLPAGTNVFNLTTNSTGTKTLYLNFKAQAFGGSTNPSSNVFGGAWSKNGTKRIAPAWDLDNNPTTYNALEQQVIYNIWRQVSDAYASTGLRVTTAPVPMSDISRTDTNDDRYGTIVAFTGKNSVNSTIDTGTTDAVGGIAFTGVVDRTTDHDYYQPAWVPAGDGVWTDASYMASAAVHEAGHTFGLDHDGRAATATAPKQDYAVFPYTYAWTDVMADRNGQPTYLFDKGEYAGATNLQDDYAVMGQHGISSFCPNSTRRGLALASPLVKGTAVNGMMCKQNDEKWYKVNHPGGVLKVTATPEQYSPHTDLGVELFSATGDTALATGAPVTRKLTYNTVSGADAGVWPEVPAGYYHVRVYNTANGVEHPSSYGARGYFSVKLN